MRPVTAGPMGAALSGFDNPRRRGFKEKKMKKKLVMVILSLVLLFAATPVYADPVYIVQPGDTLSQIAVKQGTTVQAIVAANGLTNPNLIFAGERLIIPPAGYIAPSSPATQPAVQPPAQAAVIPAGATQGTYKVKSGDTAWGISHMYGVTLEELAAANHLTNYYVYLNQVLVIPVHGAPAAAPTATPAPAGAPAGPVYSSRGLTGVSFSIENPNVMVGDEMWFDFKVTNAGGRLDYAVLSIHSDAGVSGQSWTYSHFNGNQTLEWRDHIQIYSAANYLFYLAICYDNKDACLANQAPWDRLSQDVFVSVTSQAPYTGYTDSRGIVGTSFYVEGTTHYSQDPIWFDFQVTNSNNWDVNYSVLSALVVGVRSGQSWTNSHLSGSQLLTWRDHLDGFGPGTYAFYLAICYDGRDQCLANQALWERLSNNVYVTVVDH
jgi:LysM repeat protein